VSREIAFWTIKLPATRLGSAANSNGFGREANNHYIWISFARSIGHAVRPQSDSTLKFFRCALFNCDYTQAIEMGKPARHTLGREVKANHFAHRSNRNDLRAARGNRGS
jgi:hypothetical protein